MSTGTLLSPVYESNDGTRELIQEGGERVSHTRSSPTQGDTVEQ